ncbi:unnamed protein product, partial [Ixodes pacificus]
RATFFARLPCPKSPASSSRSRLLAPASFRPGSPDDALSVVRDDESSSSSLLNPETGTSADPRLLLSSESADIVLSPSSASWNAAIAASRPCGAGETPGDDESAPPLPSGVVGGVLSKTGAEGSALDGPASAASATDVKMSILVGRCGCCCW